MSNPNSPAPSSVERSPAPSPILETPNAPYLECTDRIPELLHHPSPTPSFQSNGPMTPTQQAMYRQFIFGLNPFAEPFVPRRAREIHTQPISDQAHETVNESRTDPTQLPNPDSADDSGASIDQPRSGHTPTSSVDSNSTEDHLQTPDAAPHTSTPNQPCSCQACHECRIREKFKLLNNHPGDPTQLHDGPSNPVQGQDRATAGPSPLGPFPGLGINVDQRPRRPRGRRPNWRRPYQSRDLRPMDATQILSVMIPALHHFWPQCPHQECVARQQEYMESLYWSQAGQKQPFEFTQPPLDPSSTFTTSTQSPNKSTPLRYPVPEFLPRSKKRPSPGLFLHHNPASDQPMRHTGYGLDPLDPLEELPLPPQRTLPNPVIGDLSDFITYQEALNLGLGLGFGSPPSEWEQRSELFWRSVAQIPDLWKEKEQGPQLIIKSPPSASQKLEIPDTDFYDYAIGPNSGEDIALAHDALEDTDAGCLDVVSDNGDDDQAYQLSDSPSEMTSYVTAVDIENLFESDELLEYPESLPDLSCGTDTTDDEDEFAG